VDQEMSHLQIQRKEIMVETLLMHKAVVVAEQVKLE
jgi:hypothetical protein